jgi:alditol oxidase
MAMADAIQSNWAGNFRYGAARIHEPGTIGELQRIVAGAEKVKALGTRHSFNNIADCRGDLVSLSRFDRVIGIDRDEMTVTVEAGARYGHVAEHLCRAGYALGNMASLPHISVAGACATATHGSGDRNGNLATAVVAMEVVAADGNVIQISRKSDREKFQGMVVSLGGLGIVTKLTLAIVPAFQMRQDVYEGLPWAELYEHFDAITGSAYSVSMFTDWNEERVGQVWLKQIVGDGELRDPADRFFGAKIAAVERHPISGISAEHCTTQRGVVGPWHERLPHFRMDYTPSSGEELQSEYFVSRENATAAYEAVGRLRERIAPLLQISELRTIAADSLWMSPCHGRDCAAIHFTWKADWPGVRSVLPLIEAELLPLGARPHWGKLFSISPTELEEPYEKMGDFRKLLVEFDPNGKFRNAFLDTHIFAEA